MTINTLNKVILALAVFVLLCQLAYMAESLDVVKQVQGELLRSQGIVLRWWAVVPPLLAVTLAFATGKVIPSLALGVLAGGFIAVMPESVDAVSLTVLKEGADTGFKYVSDSLFDLWNLKILLFVLLIMMMIGITVVSGGMVGLVTLLSGFARGPKSTQFVTYLMGLAMFIDDYANTMLIGESMRPLTDRFRVSREKLAFLVDGTAAPIAGLAIVSTWIGQEVGLFDAASKAAGLETLDGYTMFFDAIWFRFYCWMMIMFMALNILTGRDYGPMRKAEYDTALNGPKNHLASGSAAAIARVGADPKSKPSAACIIMPVMTVFLVLFLSFWFYGSYNIELNRLDTSANSSAVPPSLDGGAATRAAQPITAAEPFHFDYTTLWTPKAWPEILRNVGGNSVDALILASGSGLFVALLLALALARTPMLSIYNGLMSGVMAFMVPCTILVMAWGLKEACEAVHTGEFFASMVRGQGDVFGLPMTALFPVGTFITGAVIAFATGTSWGTMAILIPIVFPIAFQLDGGYGWVCMMSMGAVLDGAILGDHCSPVSDTTIMSSFASSCDHIRHVKTQLPYGLTVGALAIGCGYLPAAYHMSFSASMGMAAVGMLLILMVFGRSRPAPNVVKIDTAPEGVATPAAKDVWAV